MTNTETPEEERLKPFKIGWETVLTKAICLLHYPEQLEFLQDMLMETTADLQQAMYPDMSGLKCISRTNGLLQTLQVQGIHWEQ